MRICYQSLISKHRKKPDAWGDAARKGWLSKDLGPDASVPGYLAVTDADVVHGKGVIAKRSFEAHMPVIAVTGTLRVIAGNNSMAFETPDPDIELDLAGPSANLVKYLNSCHKSTVHANCTTLWRGSVLYVVATRCIMPGKELLLDYAF
jgi:hypothetical protein